MAVTPNKSNANQASSKTGREPKNRTKQLGKTARKQGAPQTRRAANANTKELTAQLSQRALAGDLTSAKLLFALTNRNKPAPPAPKKRTGLSWIQQLARQPEWQGDKTQQTAFTDGLPTKPPQQP